MKERLREVWAGLQLNESETMLLIGLVTAVLMLGSTVAACVSAGKHRAGPVANINPEDLIHQWGRSDPAPPRWNKDRHEIMSDWWRHNCDRYERAWEANRGEHDEWIIQEWGRLADKDAEKIAEEHGGEVDVWRSEIWLRCQAMAWHYRGGQRLDREEDVLGLVHRADWMAATALKGDQAPPYPGQAGLLEALEAIPREPVDKDVHPSTRWHGRR